VLRGTTLGWALEAGFNRVWIAGWRLWLPVVLLVDRLVWGPLSNVFIYPEWRPSGVSIRLWPGWPPELPTALQLVTGTTPERWSPPGSLSGASLASVLLGVVALAGCWWERRRPRSMARRTFSRSALVPLFGGLCLAAPFVSWILLREETRRAMNGLPDISSYGVLLTLHLLMAACLGALSLWLPLSRERRAMLPAMLASAGVMAAVAGRSAIAAQLAFAGNGERASDAALGISAVYWVAFPVALGAGLGMLSPRRLIASARSIGVIVLAGFGAHVVLAFAALLIIQPVSATDGFAFAVTLWLVPLFLHAAIAGAATLLSLWLVAAIAALGEIGEDGTPVDALPA
jgi:hypothetical protein